MEKMSINPHQSQSVNKGKTPKLRNASGKDMKTHGTTMAKFKMGNTIFTQEFVICDELVRPMIIGRDITFGIFIGIIWTRDKESDTR